jgi:hypothetical protein
LPLLHRNPITGNGQCNRENAARGGARHHAQRHQCFKFRGKPARQCCYANDQHAKRYQPRLTEHVGQCAEDRLYKRIRQSEAGREHRSGRCCYFQILRDLWNDRIDRAHEKRRREDDERHKI